MKLRLKFLLFHRLLKVYIRLISVIIFWFCYKNFIQILVFEIDIFDAALVHSISITTFF